MKSLYDFKNLVEEEKSDYSKFDMLVRAGLADKSKIQRLHKILEKMKEERPVFNPTDRALLQNMFNKMVDLLTTNKQIFQRTRQAVREDTELNESVLDTADFKIGPSGRKVRAHRFKVGDAVKEEVEIEESTLDLPADPPFVLVLKRKAIRLYPNKTKIALYYNQKLDKYFSIPYGGGVDSAVQAESVEQIEEAVDAIGQLQKIKDSHSIGTVRHKDGTASKVDVQTAHAVLTIHKNLNDENKKKFADMVARSSHHMKKAADFAFSKVK
jgi:hypothetical protein